MKLKLLHFLSSAILAIASTTAFAASIDTPVPGSDTNSVPCTPKQRTDDYHVRHFNEDISKSQGQEFDIVLFGDSITDFWNSNPNLSLDNNPTDTKTFNMGIGSDRVQNILWRLRNGALDGYTTKYMTLMIGINNGHQKCIDHNEHADRPEDVAESIRLMLKEMATRQPDAKILLMPILPYSFDSKYFEAAEVTAMSEAVNDYILQFVDNKRIFWIDLRGKYLNQDSTPNKVCYREGGHGGYDAVGLCLHPEFFTYSDFWKPAITNAMHKYLSGDVSVSHMAEPSIGYAKAAPNADGAGSATITVHGIFLGTDANANPVATYSIDYELDGGAKTRALSNQSLTLNSFVIPNVALGQHTCRVTVTTADNKELVTVLDFTMTEPWSASALPTDASAVRTDGTLEYAYAPDACAPNGVSFSAAGNNNANISADISWPYNQTSGASAPSSVSGDYHALLNRCWWANQGDKEVTLKNLTAGHSYLVQIFGYRNYNSDSKAHVWIKESYWDPNFIKVYGDGWACGGTLTGTFTATAATKTFTIKSDGNYGINGIQVRDLGESGAAVVVQPSIGSVSATTNATAATVFLSGIALGTDDAGESATSYSVLYSLNGAAAVAALSGQSASTASFAIPNLADGEYTCAVTITTDANKTSASKSVSFRIGPPPPEVVEPFIGSASVTTNGTTATIALSEITMGTDSQGAAAASYTVSYVLNGGSAETALSDQTGATASFDIENLEDGRYTCVVTITTDKNKTAETTVSFRIGEPPPITVGWTVGPMSADASTIRTDGDLLYAYAAQNGTVGGVSFVRDAPLGDAGMVSASPAPAMGGGSWGTEGLSGDFGTMLQNGWNWTGDGTELSYTLTLAGLTPGKNYLVQLVMHRQSKNMLVSVNGSAQANLNGDDEEHYKYGASIVGLFTASAATQDITVTYTERGGDRPLNAIQVRYLGDGGGATVVAPSIESVVATTNGTTATIAISGVVMGTDDEGAAATSYAVSYALNGGAAVAALSDQSGATASFGIENLADGSYTCEVTITTDKNKTASKSVSFTIGTPPPEVVEPSIGSVAAATSGSNATISLSDVVLGTDDEGAAATSYAVSYALNGGAAVAALANQTGATASFVISNLADGSYTCDVTITTDKNKSATKSVSFAVSTSGGGGSGGSFEDGWTAAPLGATSASIRADGTLKYAYAYGTYTVNGVTFTGVGSGIINNEDCVVWEATTGAQTAPTTVPSGAESGLAGLLGHCWWASTPKGRKIKLNNLENGKQYLVQIIAFRHDFTTQSATAPDGTTTVKFGGTGWEYGSSLVRVFTASGTSEEFTIDYPGQAVINAIQVRELPEGGGGGTEETPVFTLTIPAKTGLELVSVMTNGVVVSAASGNAYSIVSNDTATVTFGAASGYEIVSGNPVVLTVTGDRTLADAEYPVVRQTGGGATVVAPSIGSVSATTNGTTATISLSGVAMGTDDEGEAATSYAVSYSLNGAAAVEALSGQSGATASFDVGNLADGSYACVVTITTDKGKTASKSVSFAIGSTPPPPDTGWTSEAMDDGGLAFSKEGDLAYAYSLQGLAVNDIPFSKANPIVVSDGIAFDPGSTGFDGNLGNEGVSDNAFGLMLGNAWYWEDSSTNAQTVTLALKRLTAGHRYLVQILSHKNGSGMLVSAGDCEPRHIYGSDAASGKYGALLTGVFTASADTQDVEITFSGSTSKRPINAVQVRDLGVDFVPVVAPAIGDLSAALSGSTAVIVLGDVEKGTDVEGVAATSYAVSYALDGGEPVEKLWNQTGWSAWFNVTNLADGAHTVEVTVATDVGGVASKSVSFTVDSTAPATSAWIVEPMSMSGDTIRTEGDLLYAEAPNLAVVNGVTFKRTLWISDASFTVSPAPADVLWSGMGNEGFNNEANAYGFLLTHAWFWDKSATNTAATVTLTGLTPGKNYLVQLVSHNQYTDTMTVSAEGTEPKPVGTRSHVENQSPTLPWRYGASLVGFFTASDTTQEFTVQWDGAEGCHPLNALQVRDLGLAVPVVVEPSIGAASATVDDNSKTAFITLSGVVKGTDDQCNPANAYDVSYELDGASVVALEDRTGATAAFPIKNLSDGPHECVVTITTDAGKTASKSVSFTINEQTPPWIVEPMTVDGDTIRTNGVRRWAFCVGEDIGTLVANGVQFTTFENLNATRLSGLDIQMPFSVSPAIDSAVDGWGTTEGVTDAGYAQILDRAFYNGASGEYTFTINGTRSELKAGRRYLVQIIMHRNGSTATATVPGFVVDHVQFGGTGWIYGGSLIGTFVPTSDREDHTFTVKFEDGDFAAINAIQLRDLGPAVPTEVDPSVESVSAKRKGTTATVTLSGVAMGTDANRHPATSYAVSYSLDNGATWTTTLTGQNGETASFVIEGLDYDDHDCIVRITTDVTPTKSASKRVTLAFAKADGLAIVYFDVEKETLAFDMGSESSVKALLPNASDIYCTVVTSTNLADVVWTPALPSLAWKANELPLDDESGWTWVGVDTADAVRFFRVALTPAPLAADDEVVFK